jgi:hypothetical protein
MTFDPNFVDRGKITGNLDSGRVLARRAGSSRSHNLIVAVTLLALFFAAIARHAPVSNEIGDSSVDRRSYAAFVTDVVASLGLCIGLAWLLFSSRPHVDDEEARS